MNKIKKIAIIGTGVIVPVCIILSLENNKIFYDFENNLREMGFGDIAVNKRMKKFISAFYGRILSYSNSYMEYKKNNSLLNFSLAIKKNIYKNKKISDEKINLISDYVVSNIATFLNNSYETNINMQFKFKNLEEV